MTTWGSRSAAVSHRRSLTGPTRMALNELETAAGALGHRRGCRAETPPPATLDRGRGPGIVRSPVVRLPILAASLLLSSLQIGAQKSPQKAGLAGRITGPTGVGRLAHVRYVKVTGSL